VATAVVAAHSLTLILGIVGFATAAMPFFGLKIIIGIKGGCEVG